MISEEHLFQAKNFLGVYKESIQTLSDIAAKDSHREFTDYFYSKLNEAKLKKQIDFDADGNLVKEQNFNNSPFPRLFDLSQSHVLNLVGSPSDYIQLYTSLQGINDKLELQVQLLKAKKSIPS